MRKLLLFSLLISSVQGKRRTRFPVLQLVTTLSEQLETKCMELLLYNNMGVEEYEEHQVFFKRMAATHTSKAYTIENYKEVKEMEKRIPLLGCNRPLRMVVGSNLTQISYEKMSHWSGSSLMKPVSFVILTMPIRNFFRNASLPINLITIAAVITSEESVELYSVFRTDTNFPLQVRKVGSWTLKDGLKLKLRTVQYKHRHFKGKVFRTLSSEYWPYTTFQGFVGQKMVWDGIYARVWKELESILRFRSVVYRREDFGIRTPSGRWTGMVREIVNNEADVIVADMIIIHNLVYALDFVNILSQTRSRMYHRQIGFRYSWNAAFLPFANDVWLVVGVNSVFITICMSFINKMSQLYGFYSGLEPIRYVDYVFFTLRTFVQQGSPTIQNSYSTRTVQLATYLTSNVAFSAYGAFLISFLSKDTPRQPFNSIDDLLKDASHKILVDYDSIPYIFSRVQSAPQGDMIKKLKELMQPFSETHYTNYTSVGLYMICKDKSLTLIERELIMNSMNPGAIGCRITEVKEYLKKVQAGIAFKRGNPYITFIRFYAHRMREAGLIERIVQKFKPPKAEVRPVMKPIRLDQISFAFVYLLFGMSLSFSLLFIEIVISSKRAKKSQQRRRHIRQV